MRIYFVYVTCENLKEAEKIGKTVVHENLAACAVTSLSSKSFYWWQGKFQENTEALLFLKTTESLADKLMTRIKELHADDVPCILSWPVEKSDPDYLKWVNSVQV